MNSVFDKAAANYDNSFTHSVIGKLQRKSVYAILSENLKQNTPKNILEINCGTGEDAVWLAHQNFNVTATDISEEMIAVAKSKTNLENLDFLVADINQLTQHFKDKKFDLVFSNFGGLNCLSKQELQSFFKNSSGLLTENGILFLVIMPKNTLWEQLYFLAKADFKSIFRRKKTNIIANVDGEKVPTFYHNPKEAVTLAAAEFEVKSIKPIGFFVSPSYLEPFFKNKPRMVSILEKLESRIKNRSWLAKYADHYCIVFQKR